jgi:hypothetical protein
MTIKLMIQTTDSPLWKFGINIKKNVYTKYITITNSAQTKKFRSCKCKHQWCSSISSCLLACLCTSINVGEWLVALLLFPFYYRLCTLLPLFNISGKAIEFLSLLLCTCYYFWWVKMCRAVDQKNVHRKATPFIIWEPMEK